jgi:predicted DNA binding CopG/RHH family protein
LTTGADEGIIWQDSDLGTQGDIKKAVMDDRKTTIRLSENLHRRVKAKAALLGTTITAVVREYLERWVEEDLPEEPEKRDRLS